jgi:hypothetical protein
MIALIVGPSRVGKTKTWEAVESRFPNCVFRHLDGLAARWALKHGWIERECVSMLRDFCKPSDDMFLAIGLQAIADLAAREPGKPLVVDVGAGFQQASYAPRLPGLYETILIIAEPKVAYGRRPEIAKPGRKPRRFEDYEKGEFSTHRRQLYDGCQHKIDSTSLTKEQAADELERVLRQVLR